MTTTNVLTARGHLVIDEAFEYRSYHYETASAYDLLAMQPGRYPFALKMLGGAAWVPGKIANGFVKPGGPYWAEARVDAVLTERYYENRLLSETRAHHETALGIDTQHVVQIYAYELYSRKTLFNSKARIELPLRWRDDTYPPVERLKDGDYDRVLSRAVGWLRENDHGDYARGEHWHIWNLINANTVGGVDGFVKAVLEGH